MHSAAMLQDMALTIEYPSIQLVELSQKGLYDRGRISKHIKFRIRTYIRKEGRKAAAPAAYKEGKRRGPHHHFCSEILASPLPACTKLPRPPPMINLPTLKITLKMTLKFDV